MFFSATMQKDEKGIKVKKGSLAVTAGLGGEERRFIVPITYLYHPRFKNLLDSAKETYGCRCSGPLKLPCSVGDFLHLLRLIESELSQQTSFNPRNYHHHPSFSLHPF